MRIMGALQRWTLLLTKSLRRLLEYFYYYYTHESLSISGKIEPLEPGSSFVGEDKQRPVPDIAFELVRPTAPCSPLNPIRISHGSTAT